MNQDLARSSNFPPRGFFVSACDTGIGKTVLMGALALALKQRGVNVAVMKPVESGVHPAHRETSDAEKLRTLLAPIQLVESVCLYSFTHPLAPLIAARMTGVTISFSHITSAYHALCKHHDLVLVEGVGGVMAPLTTQDTVRDLIRVLGLPCLLVMKTTLGSVNHALLSLEALKAHDIEVLGICFNHPTAEPETETHLLQHHATIELIKELTDIPTFGPLRFEEEIQRNWLRGVKLLHRDSSIQRLASYMIERVS